MKIKIIETGEETNLNIIDPKSGCDWTNDLLGLYNALPEYNEEDDCYEMSQDDFDWWSDLIKRYQAADDRFYQLCLDLDRGEDASDYNAIREDAANINCDLENYPEALQSICDEYENK